MHCHVIAQHRKLRGVGGGASRVREGVAARALRSPDDGAFFGRGRDKRGPPRIAANAAIIINLFMLIFIFFRFISNHLFSLPVVATERDPRRFRKRCVKIDTPSECTE